MAKTREVAAPTPGSIGPVERWTVNDNRGIYRNMESVGSITAQGWGGEDQITKLHQHNTL